MLENHEKGYNMVKKVCTIMHSLVDDWKPSPCTSRPGKSWRVVIPARISHTGKQTSKYFTTKADADAFIADQIRNLKRFGTVNGKSIDIDAYKWNTVDEILSEIGVTPLEAATHYVALVKRAGSVAKLGTLVEMGRGVAPPDADMSPSLRELATTASTAKAHNSRVTVISRKTRLGRLERLCPDLVARPCAAITPAMIRDALDVCHAGHPTSWNNLKRELSTLFNFAIKRGWIIKNPVDPIDKLPVQETEIVALTPEQLIALFRACSPPQEIDKKAPVYQRRVAAQDTTDLRLYVALGAFAGIRPWELTRLTWADISLEDGVVSVRAKHSKTGGARHVTIQPVLKEWIQACRPHNAGPEDPVINPVDLKTRLFALRTRAGYSPENPWPHDCLRHSFASYSMKAGHDLNQLSNDMGHVGISLLKTRYLNMRGLTKDSAARYWSLTPEYLATHSKKSGHTS